MGPIKPLHVFRRSARRGVGWGRGTGSHFPEEIPRLWLCQPHRWPPWLSALGPSKRRRTGRCLVGCKESAGAGRPACGRAAGGLSPGPAARGLAARRGRACPGGLSRVRDWPAGGARRLSGTCLSVGLAAVGVCSPRQVPLPRWWRPGPRVPPGVTPATAAPFRRRSRSTDFVLLPQSPLFLLPSTQLWAELICWFFQAGRLVYRVGSFLAPGLSFTGFAPS